MTYNIYRAYIFEVSPQRKKKKSKKMNKLRIYYAYLLN